MKATIKAWQWQLLRMMKIQQRRREAERMAMRILTTLEELMLDCPTKTHERYVAAEALSDVTKTLSAKLRKPVIKIENLNLCEETSKISQITSDLKRVQTGEDQYVMGKLTSLRNSALCLDTALSHIQLLK